MPVIVVAGRTLAAHLAVAIHRHKEFLARQDIPAPEGLEDLFEACRMGADDPSTVAIPASPGQSRTKACADTESSDDGAMALLVDEAGAARRLGVSARAVRRLAASGQLDRVKVGGSTRYRVADLEAFAADPDTAA